MNTWWQRIFWCIWTRSRVCHSQKTSTLPASSTRPKNLERYVHSLMARARSFARLCWMLARCSTILPCYIWRARQTKGERARDRERERKRQRRMDGQADRRRVIKDGILTPTHQLNYSKTKDATDFPFTSVLGPACAQALSRSIGAMKGSCYWSC